MCASSSLHCRRSSCQTVLELLQRLLAGADVCALLQTACVQGSVQFHLLRVAGCAVFLCLGHVKLSGCVHHAAAAASTDSQPAHEPPGVLKVADFTAESPFLVIISPPSCCATGRPNRRLKPQPPTQSKVTVAGPLP